jgi:hypothetical protein
MFDAIKEDLRQLKCGVSGSRFSDFYDFRLQHRRPGISPARIFTIFFGLLLVIAGASIGWLPGPGGFIAIIGLALLAQEFRPMAVVMDWIEPKLHAIWNWLVKIWRRMSSTSRVAVAMTLALTSATAGYAAYSILLR